MKKKSTSQSAFLNLRVLFGLFVILAGVFLALVSFGALSSVFAQTNKTNPIQGAVQPANDAPRTDLSSADPNLNPQLAPPSSGTQGNLSDLLKGLQGPQAPGPNEAWGSQPGRAWISATEFVRRDVTSPVLEYDSFFFFRAPGAATPQRYFAQLTAQPGWLISQIVCLFHDSSAANDVRFDWWKYTTNLATGASVGIDFATFTSAGTPGFGLAVLTPPAPETMHVFDPATNELINHHLGVDVASDTNFAGCYVFYQRQVAPGPATATFNDVPTSSPWFPYVEALVDTNVTGGCAPNMYCPNDPITRGQMSVFLAKALGMGFPF
jgi:S-layer homology domain